ncbi:MAG: ribosome silencing factor [Spirochaetales bacterium]|jgi:ribosome-associated protein|nr:ribosome silencing factor [Spirochaetales bacterium]
MDDTANSKTLAQRVARAIEEHKGLDTVALYIGQRSSFTDCFVITTVTSDAHMRGLRKNILDYLAEEGVRPYHRKKSIGDEGWLVMDCGALVIHLMTQEKRAFYDLERLWFEGELIFHSSSKSSSKSSSSSSSS